MCFVARHLHPGWAAAAMIYFMWPFRLPLCLWVSCYVPLHSHCSEGKAVRQSPLSRACLACLVSSFFACSARCFCGSISDTIRIEHYGTCTELSILQRQISLPVVWPAGGDRAGQHPVHLPYRSADQRFQGGWHHSECGCHHLWSWGRGRWALPSTCPVCCKTSQHAGLPENLQRRQHRSVS